MIGRTNAGTGGGLCYAFISVSYPAGAVCTCTDGSRIMRAQGTSGSYIFRVPYAATWTITATLGSNTTSKSVTVTAEGQSLSTIVSFKLPTDTYTEVQYIQSSGTQYINTGYTPNANTRFEISLLNIVSNDTYVCYMGCGNGENSSVQFALGADGSRKVRFRTNGTDYTGLASLSAGVNYSFEYAGSTLYRNGASIKSNVTAPTTMSYGVQLFGWNLGGSSSYRSKIKLGEIIFYESEVEVAHLVPCFKISNNEPGFYDNVRTTFYANAGSGTLIVGPTVS